MTWSNFLNSGLLVVGGLQRRASGMATRPPGGVGLRDARCTMGMPRVVLLASCVCAALLPVQNFRTNLIGGGMKIARRILQNGPKCAGEERRTWEDDWLRSFGMPYLAFLAHGAAVRYPWTVPAWPCRPGSVVLKHEICSILRSWSSTKMTLVK